MSKNIIREKEEMPVKRRSRWCAVMGFVLLTLIVNACGGSSNQSVKAEEISTGSSSTIISNSDAVSSSASSTALAASTSTAAATAVSKKSLRIQREKSATVESYYGLPETYPISDAKYLTEDMILRRARDVLAYAEEHKYLYGDSKATPPCTDGYISCDRLIASVLWSYGFTDQDQGGIVVKDEGNERHDMSLYLKQHGFIESIGMDAVKPGSILIVTDMRGNWKGHAFILAEMEGDTVALPDGENVKRYDAGDVWVAASQTGVYPDEPVQGFSYPKDDTVFVYNLPDITEEMLDGIYDYNYYISCHPEVVKITGGNRDNILKFFFNYGIELGHQGCAEFNVFDYMNAHPELTSKYGKDLRSYYYQYLNI